jgi:hypothetical protein
MKLLLPYPYQSEPGYYYWRVVSFPIPLELLGRGDLPSLPQPTEDETMWFYQPEAAEWFEI